MRLYWNHLWRARAYQRNTEIGRLMLEIRFSLAHALKTSRKRAGVTQTELAGWIGSNQATVSRMERPFSRVSLDQIVYALCALGADDADIAEAFHAGARGDIQTLRTRAGLRLYPRASIELRRVRGAQQPGVVQGHEPKPKKQHGRCLMCNAQRDGDGFDEGEHAEQILHAYDAE